MADDDRVPKPFPHVPEGHREALAKWARKREPWEDDPREVQRWKERLDGMDARYDALPLDFPKRAVLGAVAKSGETNAKKVTDVFSPFKKYATVGKDL